VNANVPFLSLVMPFVAILVSFSMRVAFPTVIDIALTEKQSVIKAAKKAILV
jgi:hypothetical protein